MFDLKNILYYIKLNILLLIYQLFNCKVDLGLIIIQCLINRVR